MTILDELRAMTTDQLLAEIAKITPGRYFSNNDAETAMAFRQQLVLRVATERLRAADPATETGDAERTPPSATTTVEHAKMYLRAHIGDGVDCPVCGRFTRMYRRNISGHMAQGLLAQYRAAGTNVIDTRGVWPSSSTGGPNVSLLRFWRLIEPGDEPRTWRVTDLGANWIAGRVTVPSHALLFDNRCFGIEGTPVAFADVVGVPFDLGALMADHPFPPPSDPSPELFPDA